MKAEVDKLDINELVNVPTSLNSLNTKVEHVDVGELKTVPTDSKKLSYVVDNQAVKNKKFNTLMRKANKIDKKIPDGTTLIHINQYKSEMLIKKHQTLVDSGYYCF